MLQRVTGLSPAGDLNSLRNAGYRGGFGRGKGIMASQNAETFNISNVLIAADAP
jgi:hypothetical protein